MFKRRIAQLANAVVNMAKRFVRNDPRGTFEPIVFECARAMLIAFGTTTPRKKAAAA